MNPDKINIGGTQHLLNFLVESNKDLPRSRLKVITQLDKLDREGKFLDDLITSTSTF